MIEKLALISMLTTLTTQAVKKILDEKSVEYSSNIVATIISVILTFGVQFYTYQTAISADVIFETGALVLLAFLTATLGYDKVIQTLTQLSSTDSTTETTDDSE